MQVDWLQILPDTALAYVFFIAFAFIGRFFLVKTALHLPGFENRYGFTFYSLVFGLIVSVCLYSIFTTAGVTINILVIPLLVYLLRKRYRKPAATLRLPWKEILLVVAGSVIVLHLFPESEYKQNDSFYYLKVAESLNRTGQENTFHHANILSSIFHGTEPYHYFEIWCTALAKRMSLNLYPGISLQRVVVHGIFIAAIVFGLYNLVVLQTTKIRYWHKLFCWSLVFFMPDLITYAPASANYFISNIEGNLLERPNFRIIYIILIALIAEALSADPGRRVIIFWLLFLAIVSFKFTILVLPAMVIFGLYEVVKRKDTGGWLYVTSSITFGLLFGLFYLITGVQRLSSFYESPLPALIDNAGRHWKFVLYSIAASLGYIVIICGVFLLPFAFRCSSRKELFPLLRKNLLLIVIAVTGVLAARVLFFKDNAYQFLFVAHIIAFLLTWLIVVRFNLKASRYAWILAATLFVVPAILKLTSFGNPPDVFRQNGKFVYEGKSYSKNYISAVTAYMRKNGLMRGVYIGDSAFYQQLHYSRRNPNVYFLPISYVVAGKLDGRMEFCISDSASIMKGVQGLVHTDYLASAIQRSIFFQYRKQHPLLDLDASRTQFLNDHRISYIIATAGVSTAFVKKLPATTFVDPFTGERFIAFR